MVAVLFTFQLLFQGSSFNVELEALRWELLSLPSWKLSHITRSQSPKALVLDKLLFVIAKRYNLLCRRLLLISGETTPGILGLVLGCPIQELQLSYWRVPEEQPQVMEGVEHPS